MGAIRLTPLMVHQQLGRPNGKLLKLTGDLAEKLQAAVIGIAVCCPPPLQGEGYYVGSVNRTEWELERELADAEKEFRAAFREQGQQIEWRSTTTSGVIADYLVQQARMADVLITAVDQGRSFDVSREANVGDLIIRLGRPILAMPYSVETIDIRRVLIGWKDTREARRAVLDALPLLRMAEQVSVCEIAPQDSLAAARNGLADIVAWLQRNDIQAHSSAILSTGDDAAGLTAAANDQGANLIVAGAYGHSKLREWIFGGVTANLIERSQKCLFLSH
jgi:nucleotide-binding universal stress UspA family protein